MLAAAEQARDIARAIGDDRLLARSMERQGTALSFLGRSAEPIAVLEEAVILLERVGDLEKLVTALSNLGEAHRVAGDLQQARRYNERGLETGERIGNLDLAAFAHLNLAEIELSLGGWQEAHEHLERASAVLATLPSATNQAAGYIPLILGRVLLAQGRWQEAEGSLQHALDLAQQSSDRQGLEAAHSSLAELEILQGESEAAVRRLEPLAGQESGKRLQIETLLAWALLEAGDVPRTEELASQTVALARAEGETLPLVDALWVQGMVFGRQGRREEATAALEEGLVAAKALPSPYAEGRILVELGKLEEALVIFQRLGASQDVERTQQAATRMDSSVEPSR
jgi:tetratricopeptide (TPR) repeat protein